MKAIPSLISSTGSGTAAALNTKSGHPQLQLKVRIAEILKGTRASSKTTACSTIRSQGRCACTSKYGPANEKVISGLVRVSKPGRRVYVTHDRCPRSWPGWVSPSCRPLGSRQRPRARKQKVAGKFSPTCGRSRHVSDRQKPITIPTA